MSHQIELQLVKPGLIDFGKGLDLQEHAHREVVSAEGQRGFLIVLEHLNVITVGKHCLLPTFSDSQPCPVVQVDRGGQVTAHEPGQLVVYPILPLARMRLAPKEYVHMLESLLIRTLGYFEIEGRRREDAPGVWVGECKIASIGIRIRQRVSYHGIALNISNSLDIFNKIIPCGLSDCEMTTMSDVLGRTVCFESVVSEFCRLFFSAFAAWINENGGAQEVYTDSV